MEAEGTKILVVDDDPLVRDIVAMILKAGGYQAETAENGLEAIDKFRSVPGVEVIISDMNMPEMNGNELIKEIRKIDEDVPIIILTCNHELSVAIEAIRNGANEYLLKDENIQDTLKLSVENVIRKYRLKKQLQLIADLARKNMELEMSNRGVNELITRFGQYVSPKLADEMSKNPGSFTMEGEKRKLTVLFAGVRDFTAISESLSPKELSKLMNKYMTAMTAIIQKHGGTLDKYIGAAIMAFWGAPLDDPEHARNAVLSALEMQQTMAALRPHFAERGWPELHIGIGLNTGMMSVGNMGSQFRVAYTVMGEAVNLGSRLEGVAKDMGVEIIVGEGTRNAVDDMVFRELDLIRVKGKEQPVAIYELLGKRGRVGNLAGR
ncbi:MAG: adenylate/guanylate cyclase domain-containing response regulator [Nitrospirae bacterium]|nr:adenylate/guanylate cyclase domain-containing response regulator [Nitrospirota bacterium]